MHRILVLVLAVGILIWVLSKLFAMVNLNRCPSCSGLGYWEGTRGERNRCKDCAGTGKA